MMKFSSVALIGLAGALSIGGALSQPPPNPQCGAASPPPAAQPATPTPLNDSNRGRCGSAITQAGFETYTWWTQGEQRCFSTYTPPALAGPGPTLLSMDCYSCDRGLSPNSPLVQAANRYGLSVVILSTPDGDWEFGNDGIANDASPTPCSDSDSKDNAYLRDILSFLQANPSQYDTARTFTEGFSQNSMMAMHAAQCFLGDIAGAWQGGSGLAIKGVSPTPPGKQGECSASSFAEHGHNCERIEPCEECQYWPVKPVGHGLKSCLMTYTNDFLYGTDTNMWNVATANLYDNSIRKVVLEPTSDINGGHAAPVEKYEWMMSCLEITDSCSTTCESQLQTCMRTAQQQGQVGQMRSCLDATSACKTPTGFACAPSLGAMSMSEEPVSVQEHGQNWKIENWGNRTLLNLNKI